VKTEIENDAIVITVIESAPQCPSST
jgi:hypothetical protein